MTPPFHPLTLKKIGDRVKIPRFPLDESRGYDYGTITQVGHITWDEKTPFLARHTSTLCAILA